MKLLRTPIYSYKKGIGAEIMIEGKVLLLKRVIYSAVNSC